MNSDPSWFEVDDCYDFPEAAGTIKFSASRLLAMVRSDQLGSGWHALLWPSHFLGIHLLDLDRDIARLRDPVPE